MVSGAVCGLVDASWRVRVGAGIDFKGCRRGVGATFRVGVVSWPREGARRPLEWLRRNDRTKLWGIRGFRG